MKKTMKSQMKTTAHTMSLIPNLIPLLVLGSITSNANAATITAVGVEEGDAGNSYSVQNWSNSGVAKAYDLGGTEKYGTGGYYQIRPMPWDPGAANIGTAVGAGNNLGISEGSNPTLYSAPTILSSLTGAAGTYVNYGGYGIYRGPDGDALYRAGGLSVAVSNGPYNTPSGSSNGNYGEAFSFTMGMSATFRIGIAADSVGSGTYAPDYMSIYNSGTGTKYSSAMSRNGAADMAFFDIDAAAGDTFTAAMWQRTDSGPGASVAPFSLITFDVSQYKFDVAGGNNTSTNSNVISGAAAGISKTGNGTQILSGNNTYAGNTTVSAGRLAVDNGNALGSTAAGTTVANGAQLYLNGVTVGNESLTISGTGLSDNTTSFFAGAIRSANGTSNTLQGKVNLAADARIFTGTSTSLTVDVASGDAINLGAFNLNIDGAGTHTVNDAIVGTGGLVKTGSGITTLSGTNTYTGTTTVSAGTLAVNGSLAGGMTVASIATLQGSGTISGATTVSGNLKPGNSPGLLTFANSLTLDSTAVTTMEITGTNSSGTRGVTYDAVDVASALTYGGTLALNFDTLFTQTGNYTFNLFDSGSTSGSFGSVSLAGVYSGSFTNNSGIWGLTQGDNTWSFKQSDGVLSFTVVPEPNVAMVAGSLVLMAMLRRRRD